MSVCREIGDGREEGHGESEALSWENRDTGTCPPPLTRVLLTRHSAPGAGTMTWQPFKMENKIPCRCSILTVYSYHCPSVPSSRRPLRFLGWVCCIRGERIRQKSLCRSISSPFCFFFQPVLQSPQTFRTYEADHIRSITFQEK